jgi:hypothetical protein
MQIDEFQHPLSKDDILDIRLEWEGDNINKFVINYRARFPGETPEWREIYRMDTCHDYLHEQRFWDDPEPRALKQKGKTLKQIFDEAWENISKNYARYKAMYWLKKIKRIGKEKGRSIKKTITRNSRKWRNK